MPLVLLLRGRAPRAPLTPARIVEAMVTVGGAMIVSFASGGAPVEMGRAERASVGIAVSAELVRRYATVELGDAQVAEIIRRIGVGDLTLEQLATIGRVEASAETPIVRAEGEMGHSESV